MHTSNSAGAARPRRRVLRALIAAALLSFPWLAATAAPVLSGTPAISVVAAHNYSFQPVATDTTGQKLTFVIANKPAWAIFDFATGALTGTPGAVDAGSYSNIVIKVYDGSAGSHLPPFAITVLPPDTPLVISGVPRASVTVGGGYDFTPTTHYPNGQRLTFAISNKPAWAAFDFATGALVGKPTAADVGTYSNIVIKVYDGLSATHLPPFSIAVLPPPSSVGMGGAATVSWMPPTETTAGTPLTNLAGFRIRYGTTPGLGQTVTIANPGLTRYVIDGLTPASWYFQMTAYDSAGMESPPTAIVSLVMQ